MPRVTPETATESTYDIAVVGAGAAGIALALAVKEAGLSVIILERGGLEAGKDQGEFGLPPESPHDPSWKVVRTGFGGTLNIWGGRCVPFDPADFQQKPGRCPGWPIPYSEFAPWIAPAARFLEVDPVFQRPTPRHWPELDGIGMDSVEHLSPGGMIQALRHRLLSDSTGPDILLDAPVLEFAWSGRRVQALEIATSLGRRQVSARQVVLACGGLQTTRLLLLEEARCPGRIAGNTALGRFYMGHLTGSIGEITFRSQADAAEFAYTRQGNGTPARRRFLMTPERGIHIALWIENLPLGDPRNRSGELSWKALATRAAEPHTRWSHLANVLRDPVGDIQGVASALRTRLFSSDRNPSRLIVRGPGPFRIAYHAEHLPGFDSRVRLSERRDSHGLQLLDIDFSYDDETVNSTVQAHRQLEMAVEESGFARLDLQGDDGTLAKTVRSNARDGYHQIGMTRMAENPKDGVVDHQSRVFGVDNLFVASASVFPVASQANPTLPVVAMALRLASHLAATTPDMVIAESKG